MSEPFSEVASIDYPIIDADAHVNEPPELWQERVPTRLKQRAPKVVHTPDGDVWSFDDGKKLRPVGLTATAGLSYLQFKPQGYRYETIRPGSFDTAERLKDLDADGLYAQILYPSVTLAGARTYSDDRELQLACVRAYNEWLLDFCKPSGGRLIPQAIIPTTGVADAAAELEWAVKHGHKGALIAAFPNGTYESTRDDDRFWAVAEEARFPMGIHIGSFTDAGLQATVTQSTLGFLAGAGASKAGVNSIDASFRVLFSGACERFPRIPFVVVEGNIGWIPTAMEQVDDMFLRYRWFTGATEIMKSMPSALFHRSFWGTFMIDTIGIELRHHLNIDHIMWSTDYPHTGSDWPNNRVTIQRLFRGVPKDEVKKMLHTNCKTLYGLDHVPDRLPA
ncbi:amidohydrolase family protein [Candidatus Binatia bacterium]|jgi:predicted TIM-barrel fold metal-dependent hydrolase|nr:amidohydrolase family protein [Candidatus Binatia bacterium]